MFLTSLCISTEDKAGEVGIGEVYMACGCKVLGVKRARTSPDYISGILNRYVVFISICFMIIYRINDSDDDWNFMLILIVNNASGFLIVILYRVTT